ncbi:MAG TPA: glutaredoxin domain-containing protein [Kineosporiaceae bacterium]
MRRSWQWAGVGFIGFGVLAVLSVMSGRGGTGIFLAILAVAYSVAFSPLPFPTSVTAAEAGERAAADGMPIIYWRPGCQYCLRLRGRLGRRARRAHWVNIWADPDGAARVRAAADGCETVPTVVIRGTAHVNPDPAMVQRAITTA